MRIGHLNSSQDGIAVVLLRDGRNTAMGIKAALDSPMYDYNGLSSLLFSMLGSRMAAVVA